MNTAAAAFAGTPAAAPAAAPAGTPPAGDPNTPPAGGAPAGTPAAAPAGTPPASNDTWYASFENADVRNWTQAKGFKDPSQLAESAWNLEKLLGHDRAGRTVVIPGDDAPPEELAAFRAKLGVPENADGYLDVIKVPQGESDAFAKEAAAWFHEAGIPPKQAAVLAEKWNAYQADGLKKQAEQAAANSDREFSEVVAGWGQNADANIELGKRAAAQFIPAKNAEERTAILNKLEGVLGTRTMMEMLTNIGRGLGEHRMHDNGDSGGFGMSVAEAQAKINAYRADKAWTTAYLNGDAAKKAEMERLHKIAFPATQGE